MGKLIEVKNPGKINYARGFNATEVHAEKTIEAKNYSNLNYAKSSPLPNQGISTDINNDPSSVETLDLSTKKMNQQVLIQIK